MPCPVTRDRGRPRLTRGRMSPRRGFLRVSDRGQMIDTALLGPLCREVRFAPGDVLRQKGQHYTDMYLILRGSVVVDLDAGRARRIVVSATGAPIGEISFLRGRGATATVTATTDVTALAVDDPILARLEREHPAPTAQFLRAVARIADDRLGE